MNDYWDYLEHGLLGKEQKGHKYYARVPVGKNKLGFTQYRYFYDAREYGAYMTRLNDPKNQNWIPARKNENGEQVYMLNVKNPPAKKKGTTTYATGSDRLPSSKDAQDYINKARESGISSYIHSPQNNRWETEQTKTVKDYGRPIREAKESVKKTLHEARDSHNSNRWKKSGSITYPDKTGTYTETNQISGKTRKGEVNESNYKEFTTSGWEKWEEENKKTEKYERIYQAEKFARRVRVASKKGALRVKRLLKNLGKK